MRVELLYLDGCPNWPETETRLRAAMTQVGLDPRTLALVQVATLEQAQGCGFVGSPTVLVDGTDLLPSDAPPALACRTYRQAGKLVGTPSQDRLTIALRSRLTPSGPPGRAST